MRRALLPAFALPLLLTTVTLAGVAWNRSGGREPMVLAATEFHLLPRSDDRSAARVAIAWQQVTDPRGALGRERLADLGFDMSVDPASPGADRVYGRMLPRRVWVAFELDGAAFAALRESAGERGSRLVPVDAATDAGELARRYPDGSRYLVTAADVRPALVAMAHEPPYLIGMVDAVQPRELHVPRHLAPARDGTLRSVSVRYGRRFEPWITDSSR